MEEEMIDSQTIELETPADNVFVPPSIDESQVINGVSYTHFSDLPKVVTDNVSTECVLGVDEAGRGPVLGPMVYGVFYLPLSVHHSLLAETHHFDDSKVLTAAVRSDLMEKLCTSDSDLYRSCGWATRVMSARDISSGMLRPMAMYNLNAQAMDATIDLIKGVFERGVNVTEIYIDTIGSPIVYQRKLEKIFPTVKITVAKKADSLYPCVSAASVCAKVTRDAALEVSAKPYVGSEGGDVGWGSGYPSDARCSTWLKQNMDPVFGWGPECRFSWSTAKDLLETKNKGVSVVWPVDDADDDGMKMTDFFSAAAEDEEEGDELSNWYGKRVTEEVF